LLNINGFPKNLLIDLTGPIFPVSRGWTFGRNPINNDWQYVLFDWDNYFTSYLAGLDKRMKNMAYSNIIQITKVKRLFNKSPTGPPQHSLAEIPLSVKNKSWIYS